MTLTCIGNEQTVISQTLKFLEATLSFKATSQMAMSPTFVPTVDKTNKECPLQALQINHLDALTNIKILLLQT